MAIRNIRSRLLWSVTFVAALTALTATASGGDASTIIALDEPDLDGTDSSTDPDPESSDDDSDPFQRNRCGNQRSRCGTELDRDPVDIRFDTDLTVTDGEFDELGTILNGLRRQHRDLESCYWRALEDDPHTEGSALLELTVGQAAHPNRSYRGEITDVEVLESTVSSDVADCAAQQLSTGRFGRIPAPQENTDGERTATIEVTYQFSQTSD